MVEVPSTNGNPFLAPTWPSNDQIRKRVVANGGYCRTFKITWLDFCRFEETQAGCAGSKYSGPFSSCAWVKTPLCSSTQREGIDALASDCICDAASSTDFLPFVALCKARNYCHPDKTCRGTPVPSCASEYWVAASVKPWKCGEKHKTYQNKHASIQEASRVALKSTDSAEQRRDKCCKMNYCKVSKRGRLYGAKGSELLRSSRDYSCPTYDYRGWQKQVLYHSRYIQFYPHGNWNNCDHHVDKAGNWAQDVCEQCDKCKIRTTGQKSDEEKIAEEFSHGTDKWMGKWSLHGMDNNGQYNSPDTAIKAVETFVGAHNALKSFFRKKKCGFKGCVKFRPPW
jgi:hypothetical protein